MKQLGENFLEDFIWKNWSRIKFSAIIYEGWPLLSSLSLCGLLYFMLFLKNSNIWSLYFHCLIMNLHWTHPTILALWCKHHDGCLKWQTVPHISCSKICVLLLVFEYIDEITSALSCVFVFSSSRRSRHPSIWISSIGDCSNKQNN